MWSLPADFKFPRGKGSARAIFRLFKVGNFNQGVCALEKLNSPCSNHFRISGAKAKYKKCKRVIDFMDKALTVTSDGKVIKKVFEETKTNTSLAEYFTAAQNAMLQYMPKTKKREINRHNIELTTVCNSLATMKKNLENGTTTAATTERRRQI